MKSRISLTKKDLFVGLCCAVFVFANLGAIGSGGRRRAKEAACLSNLLRLGRIMWQWYADSYDFTCGRGGCEVWWGTSRPLWPRVILDYKPDVSRMLLFCPEAVKPSAVGGQYPFAAWSYSPENEPAIYSSYCANFWGIGDPVDDDDDYFKFWRTPYIADAARVPLLLDGNWKDAAPEPTDEPWETREHMVYMGWEPHQNEVKRVCIDRHGPGANTIFFDLSARKVGLKQLWLLKWHRQWPEGTDHLPDWPLWMENFKDY